MKLTGRRFIFFVIAMALADLRAQAVENDRSDSFHPLDTQISGKPLSPREAVCTFHLPGGFHATVAAAEPDVRQPIAICYDDRGRLWVAESYSYGGSKFTTDPHDRILILDDRDGDGVFESRKIFADGLNRLTGLAWGFGGIWITTAPHLAFIPDRNGDDQPDGETEIHLDGWSLVAEHNSVNGLTWGPDGWLYGRHGIKAPSRPGRPGTPTGKRPEFSCGIWRYHPTRHAFEVVAEGTVNPWGLDSDSHGQMFFSSSVVDHLWHLVPGAHFDQSPSALGNPHLYETMGPTNDHSHRPEQQDKDTALDEMPDDVGGGGHSHVNLMIYQGGHWPEVYHGGLFVHNFIGRRLNWERLERDPVTGRIIARHGPDFLTVDAPWFRGVSIRSGPDGDVVLTDWSDEGECHDRDGVSRSTGRIYKISWGKPRKVEVNLKNADPRDLVAMQTHPNDWFARHARRLLQETVETNKLLPECKADLLSLFHSASGVTHKLRALWTLHAIGQADSNWLVTLLDHPDENLRYWAVRLLVDHGVPSSAVCEALVKLGEDETCWLPRMALASAIQSLKPEYNWQLGKNLTMNIKEEDDPNLVRLLWMGWQPQIMANTEESLQLAVTGKNSRLRQWIARRIASAAGNRPAYVEALLAASAQGISPEFQSDLLQGMEAGLEEKTYDLDSRAWKILWSYYNRKQAHIRHVALLLGAKLQDRRAIEELGKEFRNSRRTTEDRRQILQALLRTKPPGLLDELLRMIDRREFLEPAIRSVSTFSDPRIAPKLVNAYPTISDKARSAVVDALLARPDTAHALLDAITEGMISKSAISSFQARQLRKLQDSKLTKLLDEVWGHTNPSPAAIEARIRDLKMILKDTAFMQAADLEQGGAHFEQRCMTCHKMFDRGGNLGPDLTGADRKNLDYLLTNIIDPNAEVLANHRLSVLTLDDGRTLSGTITGEYPNSVDFQTTNGDTTIERARIQAVEHLNTSLMPVGLLDDLNPHQVRDLIAYLMAD